MVCTHVIDDMIGTDDEVGARHPSVDLTENQYSAHVPLPTCSTDDRRPDPQFAVCDNATNIGSRYLPVI